MKLNLNQKKAVKHAKGPLLIVAGAGTGKTTVITERIKYLIQKKNVDPQHIFAATFTQKASEEMLERLDKVMPLGYQEPWLGTFHALCDRFLKLEGLEIGINSNFNIMTQSDQWIFIKNHLFDFQLDYYRPLGNPNKFISALIQFFSRLQDEDVSTEEFNNLVRSNNNSVQTSEEKSEVNRLKELAAAYQKYQELKYEYAVADFGDLIANTLILLRSRPNILNKFRDQFQHILIDEFQDTNYSQYQLIKLLAPSKNKPNLVVVGDDDQSIYKFRGAAVSNILEFKKDYQEVQLIVLDDNYRSTQPILDSAYSSIINNNPDRLETKLKINKKLKSKQSKKTKPEIVEFRTLNQEIDWTIDKTIHLIAQKDLTYKDIAILTRSNSQLEPYVKALKIAGLPFQRISNRGLFDQEEVSILIDLIKTIADPTDSIALFSISLSHIASIKPEKILPLLNHAKRKATSLWDIYCQSTDNQIIHLASLIKSFQEKIDKYTITQLLFEFINTTHFLKPFINEENLENQLKINNINIFFEKLKQFERSNQQKDIVAFLDVLELWLQAGENPGQAQIEDIDTISLMTVHAAKGLEFDTVFLGSMIAGRFPVRNRKDPILMPVELIKETLPEGNEHIQEERRLFYVALTRAKNNLFCTYAKDVGGVRKRHPSGFLNETHIPVQLNEQTNNVYLPQASRPKPQARYLEKGEYKINKVSYSQIDTFAVCPLKYKYRYLLQIPARPHHSLSFGRTMHETLHQFHQLELNGRSPGKKEMIKLYKDNFIEEGYDSPDFKLERFNAGKVALTNYIKCYKKILSDPKYLELSFSIMFEDTKLVGKIDRIDLKSDGTLEIIDYKTGTPKDQKKVDKDEQLTIYTLAANKAFGLDINSASLYFLEGGGKKITTTRTKAQLTKAQSKLSKVIKKMKRSTFPAKPDPVKCGFCEYSTLCPYSAAKT